MTDARLLAPPPSRILRPGLPARAAADALPEVAPLLARAGSRPARRVLHQGAGIGASAVSIVVGAPA